MKVHLFNHWFKHKVSIDTHFDQIKDAYFKAKTQTKVWNWLDEEYDIGQYYSYEERQSYLVFHNEHHYLMFLLKL